MVRPHPNAMNDFDQYLMIGLALFVVWALLRRSPLSESRQDDQEREG